MPRVRIRHATGAVATRLRPSQHFRQTTHSIGGVREGRNTPPCTSSYARLVRSGCRLATVAGWWALGVRPRSRQKQVKPLPGHRASLRPLASRIRHGRLPQCPNDLGGMPSRGAAVGRHVPCSPATARRESMPPRSGGTSGRNLSRKLPGGDLGDVPALELGMSHAHPTLRVVRACHPNPEAPPAATYPGNSRAAISATCLPWNSAMASSFSVGRREPSGPAMVERRRASRR